ncbi:hypothetical protein GC163_20930 [bacterium]|nr:hypothetical protein [bacterium]
MPHRVLWLCRLLGFGGLALMAVTWKLWTPQDVFPRVPLLFWAPPHAFDWTSLVVTVVGLTGLLVVSSRPGRTIAAMVTACGFAMLFLSDQHRLQPWAWQFFLLAILVALADERGIVTGWRWLAISIYVYSALSKFDVVFVENWGRIFSTLFAPKIASWQVPSSSWTQVYLEQVLPWTLPAGELLVAILLAIPRTRRYGLYGSWMMHLSLLGILGPMGLNHSWGVIGWNLFFLAQNALLWWEWGPFVVIAETHEAVTTPSRQRLTYGYLAIIVSYPALYPLGLLDAWLGWAVYAPPYQKVHLRLRQSMRPELFGPVRSVQPQWGLSGEKPDWYPALNLEHWSHETLGVPSYPSVRFETAVFMDVWQPEVPLGSYYFQRYHRTSRWQHALSPTKPEHIIFDYEALWNHAAEFWFNAFPESVYRQE